jgi:ABC-type antimicrobial peptide transport system permease subunit
MTLIRLALASLWHFRRTHLAVVGGVATAVAVLAGSLLVGASVRQSLAGLVTDRLGRAGLVVAAENPFADSLGTRLRDRSALASRIAGAVPLFALEGVVTHQPSGRRAGNVSVYGVDARFFAFHGVTAAPPSGANVWLSPDLAAELGASNDEAVVLRVARPTDIPLDSLHGRKDDVGRAMRLRVEGTLAPDLMGEFSLSPSQGPVRAIFVDLARVQRDLDQPGRVNALLVSTGDRSSGVNAAALVSALGEVLEAGDLGLTVSVISPASLLVETSSGLLSDDVAAAVTRASGAAADSVTPVLSWLANRMTAGGKSTPYSLVVGIGPAAAGDAELAWLLGAGVYGDAPAIVLNDWTARDLAVNVGDPLEMEYYRWIDEGRLVTERASFRVIGIVPIRGLAADRRLSPPYPGITDSESVADWNPPFPIDLTQVRPVDEDYWDRYSTTAKAFIPLAVAQRLWGTRYGKVSSLRIAPDPRTPGPQDPRTQDPRTSLAAASIKAIGSVGGGLTVVDVRTQNIAASAGATDFGAYFSYFSFFLVVSALLLTALFFRLGVEQRLREIGVLRATGYSLKTIRRLFLTEGAIVAVVGAVAGMALAVGWAALMMYGLRTWWVGAVGTTALVLHVEVVTLVIGAAAAEVAALACIAWTIRGLSRQSPRELLAGSVAASTVARRSRGFVWAAAACAAALFLTAATVAGRVPAAAGFFGAGGLVLVSGLTALAGWLRRRSVVTMRGAGVPALVRFGWDNAAWRPGRSLTSAGLVAAAAFLLVSVDAFRKDTSAASDRTGGTGGFALIAESVLPLVNDPESPDGREALGLRFDSSDNALSGVSLIAARLRPGDDASCLNLYQPKQPRVVGVSEGFINERRFTFAASTAVSDEDTANPWRLLLARREDGAVPAIVDATSLQYVLHAAVGDEVMIDAETARPVRLRIVGSLSDSMLQGEIMIAEPAFTTTFPEQAGARVLLVDVAPERAGDLEAIAATLEERLEPYGVDVQSSVRRLEAYHRVENTYLSTFQTLGGLGLVLGTIGLAAVTLRNVFERRRELALLAATGYPVRALSTLVVSETLGLVLSGLVIGTAAALVAIAPVLSARGGRPPALSMVWLAAVAASGVVTALIATRAVRRLPLVASLRSE